MPIVSPGETLASIIALVVAGIVAFALLAFIAIKPLRDYEECAALVAAGPADDEPSADELDNRFETTAVLTPPPPPALVRGYVGNHRAAR
jgi:hypothetical protein